MSQRKLREFSQILSYIVVRLFVHKSETFVCLSQSAQLVEHVNFSGSSSNGEYRVFTHFFGIVVGVGLRSGGGMFSFSLASLISSPFVCRQTQVLIEFCNISLVGLELRLN